MTAMLLAPGAVAQTNIQLYNQQTRGLEIVAQLGFKQDFLDHFRIVTGDSSACGRALQRRGAAGHRRRPAARLDADDGA